MPELFPFFGREFTTPALLAQEFHPVVPGGLDQLAHAALQLRRRVEILVTGSLGCGQRRQVPAVGAVPPAFQYSCRVHMRFGLQCFKEFHEQVRPRAVQSGQPLDVHAGRRRGMMQEKRDRPAHQGGPAGLHPGTHRPAPLSRFFLGGLHHPRQAPAGQANRLAEPLEQQFPVDAGRDLRHEGAGKLREARPAVHGFQVDLARQLAHEEIRQRQPFVQRFLKARVDALPEGPSETERASSRTTLLAEAEAPGEKTARAMLETPNGYTLTFQAAVEIAARVVRGEAPTGFHTPSSAFGADFVLELPDCVRTDLD